MEAKELRLGNWIEYLGKNVEVTTSVIHAVHRIVHESEMYKPIPLTPAILVACGFHKDNYGVFELVRDNAPYVSGCDILLWVKECEINGKNVWNVCYGKEFDSLVELCNINYLHQLQNLIHSLTGKEITVTL